MLTVPEAARRTGRNPETIRRWIRAGRLRAEKVGTQYLVDEEDLDAMEEADSLPVPDEWKTTWTGEPQVDWVRIVRQSREGH